MFLSLTQKHKVTSFEIDNHGFLKLSGLFELLQDNAYNNATLINCGYDVMKNLGIFWILSRIKIRLERVPRWNDEISLTTWPRGFDKLFGVRDFIVRDSEDHPIITATSYWLIIDAKTYMPRRLSTTPLQFPDIHSTPKALDEPLSKLESLHPMKEEFVRKIMISDIDVNHHVNNARYLDFIQDAFHPDGIRMDRLESIQVNYNGESRIDDQISIRKSGSGEDFSVELLNADSGKSVLFSSLKFKNQINTVIV
jgi:acyl-ACP thioesterase